MPTTRRRRLRPQARLTADELQWLTGETVDGASKLWSFRGGAERVERCRLIMQSHANLIPHGRRAELLSDIDRWSPPKPLGLASFR